MKRYDVEVRITPREGLLDPEGKAVHHALTALEFDNIEGVRMGRLVRIHLDADSGDAARTQVETMCRKLLANPVTEDFHISLEEA